jgi:hypothetical protein
MRTTEKKDKITFEVSATGGQLNTALEEAQAKLERYFDDHTHRMLRNADVTRDIDRSQTGEYTVALKAAFTN